MVFVPCRIHWSTNDVALGEKTFSLLQFGKKPWASSSTIHMFGYYDQTVKNTNKFMSLIFKIYIFGQCCAAPRSIQHPWWGFSVQKESITKQVYCEHTFAKQQLIGYTVTSLPHGSPQFLKAEFSDPSWMWTFSSSKNTSAKFSLSHMVRSSES